MNAAIFLVLAALTVAAALTVVLNRNPVHAACGLVATLFLMSVHFMTLDAPLVAVLQVIVYAGAIVVLFLFVIMLLNLGVERRAMAYAPLIAAAAVGAGGFVLLMALLLRGAPGGGGVVPAGFGETVAVANRLFTTYLLPFELTSLLLLVAIVGAVALAQRRT